MVPTITVCLPNPAGIFCAHNTMIKKNAFPCFPDETTNKIKTRTLTQLTLVFTELRQSTTEVTRTFTLFFVYCFPHEPEM